MSGTKGWRRILAGAGRIEPEAIVAVYRRAGLVPCRLGPFGPGRRCDPLAAIDADRVGHEAARRRWLDYHEAPGGEPFRRAMEAYWRARSDEIGLTRHYAMGYLAGWDGRRRGSFLDPEEQAEFERGYDDGAAGLDRARAELGYPESSPFEEVDHVVEDQAVS